MSELSLLSNSLTLPLDGDLGTGKRITRLHVLHYAFLNDFIVLDIPAG